MKAKNKALEPEREIRNDYTPATKEYYFHGEGKYQPEKILAADLKEATTIYEKIRKLI